MCSSNPSFDTDIPLAIFYFSVILTSSLIFGSFQLTWVLQVHELGIWFAFQMTIHVADLRNSMGRLLSHSWQYQMRWYGSVTTCPVYDSTNYVDSRPVVCKSFVSSDYYTLSLNLRLHDKNSSASKSNSPTNTHRIWATIINRRATWSPSWIHQTSTIVNFFFGFIYLLWFCLLHSPWTFIFLHSVLWQK